MGKKKESGFGRIPQSVFKIGLSTGALALYACLAAHANKENNKCWPSRERLMYMCGFGSKSTFSQKLKELEDSGIVTVTRGRQKSGGVYTTSVYILNPPSMEEET